jgi:hypothetical protein
MADEVDHYTAVIELHEVKILKTGVTRAVEETSRNKVELARIVVRAKTVEELNMKVKGHIDLVNES